MKVPEGINTISVSLDKDTPEEIVEKIKKIIRKKNLLKLFLSFVFKKVLFGLVVSGYYFKCEGIDICF